MQVQVTRWCVQVMRTTHTWMGTAVKGAVTYAAPFWKEAELAGALYSQTGPFIQMYDQSSHDGKHAALVRSASSSPSPYIHLVFYSPGWLHELGRGGAEPGGAAGGS